MLEWKQLLEKEKYKNHVLIKDLEREVAEFKQDKLKLIEDNTKLNGDKAQLKIKMDSLRYDMTVFFLVLICLFFTRY